ncbi:MAG: hypothetical protein KGO96_07080 [Elusimicrobia bacterium]|nr:hypothetical protein [Elusimicrobiota bacterium]
MPQESGKEVKVEVKADKEYAKALMAIADELFALRDFHSDTEFTEQHGLGPQDGVRFLQILDELSNGVIDCLERDFPEEYEKYMEGIG